MGKSVELTNVKGIESLRFDLPKPGIYLLAGTNGVGKTSLLACLLRIKHSSAFPQHFPTSRLDKKLDDFSRSQIAYEIDDRKVTYIYGGERWVPQPRKESGLLSEFGYPDVIYIGANASRISPRSEDFNLKRLKAAKKSVCEAANAIFDTAKFSTLKETNVKQGATPAYVLQVTIASGQFRYVSERNLSLGELCILKLLRRLDSCTHGSLVLVDEVELALHPRAQMGLFEYLEGIAAAKGLTIIVSSHSVTLIKTVNRRKILFLEREENTVKVIHACFPAYALREVAHKEERAPDSVIYVEDEAAQAIVERLSQLVIACKYKAQVPPSVQVIPVGGYDNVLRFFDRSSVLLPPSVRRGMVLDKDAQTELELAVQLGTRQSLIELTKKHVAALKYLPTTPEVGLVAFLREHHHAAQKQLRDKYMNQQILLPPVPGAVLALPEIKDKRDKCKGYLKQAVELVCGSVHGRTAEEIRAFMYAISMDSLFDKERDLIMQMFGSIL